MQVLSMIWGIFAIIGMIVGFFPCLGALNWLNIPFAAVGLIISVIALATSGNQPKGGSIGGLICCLVAVFFGVIRLILGQGLV